MTNFNQDELLRYSRHFSVSDIGIAGQKKLKAASILLIGAGGIGSPAALYLAACGIGRLGIIDHDSVEISNLQRQILYTTGDCGQAKAQCAEQHLSALNPNVVIEAHTEKLTSSNAHQLIQDYDLVIDGSDNYPTRYLVNDVCAEQHTPLISSSIYQFSGQLGIFCLEGQTCYRCLYPDPPPAGLIPNCAQAGVLGVIPGILATLAVSEAIKLITGAGQPLIGQLATFDASDCSLKKYSLKPSQHCRICANKTPFSELPRYEPEQKDSMVDKVPSIDAQTLKQWLDRERPLLLLDVREPWEREIAAIMPSLHIPLRQVSQHHQELPQDQTIVVYCKSGIRSHTAAEWLLEQGHQNVINLQGGIIGWATNIDSALRKY